jgi:Outer membrane protein beta-barrel domain
MRRHIAVVLVAASTLVAGAAQAADLPVYYPPAEMPEVDYGLQGSYYLRGSIGANAWWAKETTWEACIPGCGGTTIVTEDTDEVGFGYSVGAGFGYETGDGLRADVTVDYLHNRGFTTGDYTVELRSTLALANVYYDFAFGDYSSAAGGFGAYVGAGLGLAHNRTHSEGPDAGPDGSTVSGAAALMAGATYDMGSLVADLGYRMVYIPQITNGDAATDPASPYYANNNFIHEVRGTLRYRFN